MVILEQEKDPLVRGSAEVVVKCNSGIVVSGLDS
jgi:hypothetical protein